ncbi:MAG TPA: hypothetical protein VN414_06490 [Methanosarcina sp.]|nr:hypothetical protein [Methanosarcina sp.]
MSVRALSPNPIGVINRRNGFYKANYFLRAFLSVVNDLNKPEPLKVPASRN